MGSTAAAKIVALPMVDKMTDPEPAVVEAKISATQLPVDPAPVAVEMPSRIVLGADQTLTLGGRRFSKPADRAGAREQLRALRRKTHRLHSALALVREGAEDFVNKSLLSERPDHLTGPFA